MGGSANLRPERAWDMETGLELNGPRRLRADLTLFEWREQDVIDHLRDSPTAIWQAANIDRLHFDGIESSLSESLFQEVRMAAMPGRAVVAGVEAAILSGKK